MDNMKILVTGSEGFIGSHLVTLLREKGHMVRTLDIKGYPSPYHTVADIRNIEAIRPAFTGVEAVVHLAAIPGILVSVENPENTVSTNIYGTNNVIKLSEELGIDKFIYASSSSVYDDCAPGPYEETHPLLAKSPYSASKIANEHSAASSSLRATVGLRFFTVYGPNGRPDMAYSIFTKAISENRQITITGANTSRDFTHVTTVTNAISDLLELDIAGHSIFNIGNGEPATLFELATHIGNALLKPIRISYRELPAWSVSTTHGSTTALEQMVSLKKVSLKDGVANYVKWFSSVHFT